MGVNTQLSSNDSIEVIVAIPAYNERETLPIIVKELSLSLSEKDAILILDDSPFQIHAEIQSAVTIAAKNSRCVVFLLHRFVFLFKLYPFLHVLFLETLHLY